RPFLRGAQTLMTTSIDSPRHGNPPWQAADLQSVFDLAGGDVDDGDVVGGAVRGEEATAVGAHADAPGARADSLDAPHDGPLHDVDDGDRAAATGRDVEALGVG